MLEPFDYRERLAIDLVETSEIPRQRVQFTVNPVATEIFQQVVMRMDAVERRVRGMDLVQISEQVVDEVRQRLRSDHRSMTADIDPRLPSWAQHDLPMVQ